METAVVLGLVPLFAARPLVTLVVASVCFELAAFSFYGRSPTAVVVALLPLALQVLAGAVVTGCIEAAVDWVKAQLRAVSEAVTAAVNALWQVLSTVMFVSFVVGHAKQALLSHASAPAEVALAGFELHSVLLVLGAIAVWLLMRVRANLAAALALIPLLDSKPVARVFNLAETVFVVFSVVAVFLAPWLGWVVFAMSLVAVGAVWLALRLFDEHQRSACPACQARVHRGASLCHACKAVRTPNRVGLLGRALEKPVDDLARHRNALLAGLRCPSCAESLRPDGANTRCGACGETFSRAAAASLAKYADRQMLLLAPVLIAVGVLPGLGMALGFLVYRLSPASAVGQYTRWTDRAAGRVLRAAGLFGLTLIQPVPLLGCVVVPAFVALMHVPARQAMLRATA